MRVVLLMAPEAFQAVLHGRPTCLPGQVGGSVRQGTNDRLLEDSHISETTMRSEIAYCC